MCVGVTTNGALTILMGGAADAMISHGQLDPLLFVLIYIAFPMLNVVGPITIYHTIIAWMGWDGAALIPHAPSEHSQFDPLSESLNKDKFSMSDVHIYMSSPIFILLVYRRRWICTLDTPSLIFYQNR